MPAEQLSAVNIQTVVGAVQSIDCPVRSVRITGEFSPALSLILLHSYKLSQCRQSDWIFTRGSCGCERDFSHVNTSLRIDTDVVTRIEAVWSPSIESAAPAT